MAEDNQKNSDNAEKRAEKKQPNPKNIAVFGEDFEIYCDQRLEERDVSLNKAYRASSKKYGGQVFAVVSEQYLLPRRNAASIYSGISNSTLARLLAYGRVYWPPKKCECYVFIYQDDLGERILERGKTLALGWKQDAVMDSIVRPMAELLQDLRNKDLFHGGIRVDNMFTGGSDKRIQNLMLGDCLSAPPSFAQPVLYETIERSIADPIARGRGVSSDDLYALGVCLAVFMRTQDPMEGFSDEKIIREKIVHGSYAAITGKDRFKGSILELLRGLLHDDPAQRWSVDEVMSWLDGRRLTPKQAVKKKKAARPFVFQERKVLYAPLLAFLMPNDPSQVHKIVEDNSLEQWIDRALEDDEMLERMEAAVLASGEGGHQGEAYQNRLVANLSVALDPMVPMQFRGLRAMGEGIGSALYESFVLKRDIKLFADMFLQLICMNWISISNNPNIDIAGLMSKFDSCRNVLRQNKAGYGIERCLYILAPEAPCLSEKLAGHYVTSPEDFMYALENICAKGNFEGRFLDRHSIAFLSVNDSKNIDNYIFDLNSDEEHRQVLAALKCFATIQTRSKMQNFPALAKAIFKRIPVVLKRYHDVEIREKLTVSLTKFAEVGSLSKMAALLSDPELNEHDYYAFKHAMAEYEMLRQEHAMLDMQLLNEKTFGRASGRAFSAMVSSILAVLLMCFTTYIILSK